MSQNRMQWVLAAVLLLALMLTVVFSVRSLRQIAPAPTIDIPRVQTEAVAAFAFGLTGTARAMPSVTATETNQAATTPTETVGTEVASTSSTESGSTTPSCLRSKFVSDVTIPDYSIMTPAEVFTKTWRMQNNGTCPWQPGFRVVLIGGVAMGGSPYTLVTSVNPGGQLDISIKMAAPTNQTGLVQGTWQMTDQNGNTFGNVMTVNIVLGGKGTAAPTAAASATP